MRKRTYLPCALVALMPLVALIAGGLTACNKEPKPTVSAQDAAKFQHCKEAIAKDLKYTGELTGEGVPIVDQAYRSFMIHGQEKDLFSCDVSPDGRYKIMAALGGQRPFKKVASGQFPAAP
jgi:hypothetical protein